MFHVKRELPPIEEGPFTERIEALSPVSLPRGCTRALWIHYRELRRWNRTLSLIGPGTLSDVLERHYGESLAALPLLAPGGGTLLDVGSGAGFPGFVLAAARPDLSVILLEARQRKCAFLRAASRKAGVPVSCLHARLQVPLPEGLPTPLKSITLRAIRLPRRYHDALARALGEEGQMLVWSGERPPIVPEGLERVEDHPLLRSERRRILVLKPRRST